jgi:hypothetical protein
MTICLFGPASLTPGASNAAAAMLRFKVGSSASCSLVKFVLTSWSQRGRSRRRDRDRFGHRGRTHVRIDARGLRQIDAHDLVTVCSPLQLELDRVVAGGSDGKLYPPASAVIAVRRP